MELARLAAEGVDVSMVLDLPMLLDSRTGLLHAARTCNELPVQDGFTSPSRASVSSLVCDVCWDWRMPPDLEPFADSVRALLETSAAFDSLEREGLDLFAAGSLFERLEVLAVVDPALRPWAARLSARIVSAMLGLLGDVEVYRSRVLETLLPGGVSVGEGLLFVSEATEFVVAQLLEAELGTLLAWWVPSSPVPGVLVRGPVEVLSGLGEVLSGLAEYPDHVSWAALEPGDSPAVVETALSLLDSTDGLFHRVDTALRAARAL